ncbi:MAG TPA: DMT family transporter, partial [Chryseolinea sp.]|nr:DMT family transporter [Chryseolinea sp.]
MEKAFWIILALLSGAALPIQAGLNARLGTAAQSPVYASAISFIVGILGLLMYIAVTRQTLSLQGVRDMPFYLWVGGLLGAFYVTAIVLLFPRLGAG